MIAPAVSGYIYLPHHNSKKYGNSWPQCERKLICWSHEKNRNLLSSVLPRKKLQGRVFSTYIFGIKYSQVLIRLHEILLKCRFNSSFKKYVLSSYSSIEDCKHKNIVTARQKVWYFEKNSVNAAEITLKLSKVQSQTLPSYQNSLSVRCKFWRYRRLSIRIAIIFDYY